MPNLLIIGAQKSGTTWLYNQLSEHPDIFLSRRKELEFFTTPGKLRDIAAYKAHFSEAKKQRYVGEATPAYFWTYDSNSRFCGLLPERRNTRVPEAVHKILGPDVKLIVILRQPVHRAISAYFHHFKQGRIKPDQKLLKIGRRYGIIDIGFYARHLARWEEVFGPGKILTLFFDDVRKHPAETLDKVSCYLGLPSIPTTNVDSRKTNLGYRLVREGDVITPDRRDPLTYQFMLRRGTDTGELPSVDKATIVRLQELYAEDIEVIENRFDRKDLGWSRRPRLSEIASSKTAKRPGKARA
jgi:Sulfotransferase family